MTPLPPAPRLANWAASTTGPPFLRAVDCRDGNWRLSTFPGLVSIGSAWVAVKKFPEVQFVSCKWLLLSRPVAKLLMVPTSNDSSTVESRRCWSAVWAMKMISLCVPSGLVAVS